MNITVVSRSWPSNERSGVSLVAALHVKVLQELGHKISIIGSNKLIDKETICHDKTYIRASGSGSLYSPARIDRNELRSCLIKSSPDLVIVEAWQTALTDSSIDIAYDLNIPVLMISHGISIYPYSLRLSDLIRFLAWWPYKVRKLSSRIGKLSAITCLDSYSVAPEYFCRPH